MEPHVDLGERFVQSDCRGKVDDETGTAYGIGRGGATAAECCNAAYIQSRGGVYPHPRCYGAFALYLVHCW